jgi:hypothetical protein
MWLLAIKAMLADRGKLLTQEWSAPHSAAR